MSVDTLRSDVSVVIDGETIVLKPTFATVRNIERVVGLNIQEIRYSILIYKVSVIADVLFEALRGSGVSKYSLDDVGDLIMADIDKKEQPLIVAAFKFVDSYFPRQAATEKKPTPSPKRTGSKRSGGSRSGR